MEPNKASLLARCDRLEASDFIRGAGEPNWNPAGIQLATMINLEKEA
jgi:hypothetical protein